MLARVDISFSLTLARQGYIDFIIRKIDLYGADIFYLTKIHRNPLARLISGARHQVWIFSSAANDGSLPSSEDDALIAF